MRRHPRRAPVNPGNPKAWGTSDRNGMVGTHARMQFQHQWAGFSLVNTRVLVHPDELDKPQRQLGAFVLPPDPMPIANARPENYYIDELYAQISTTYTIPSVGYIIDASSSTASFNVTLPSAADESGSSVTVNNNGESFSVVLFTVSSETITDLQTDATSTTYSIAAEASVTLLSDGTDWNTWSPVP